MYKKFFQFKEDPFSTTPDPRFFYRSETHQEALDRLVIGVTKRQGLNAIIGEPGLGKSIIIRTLIGGLRKSIRFAWVFNTTLTSRELIKYICRDFGFNPKSDDMSEIFLELYSFLMREYETGYIPLLIVDEAQNLKPQVLEQIRQLSNLETSRNKLIQIILSGQPQLDFYLNHPSLQQLKQRICMKAVLTRLGKDETKEYIQHRLNKAGSNRIDIFTDEALNTMYRISDGIPRLINQVADNALMVAARKKERIIDANIVLELVERGLVMSAGMPPVYENASIEKSLLEKSARETEVVPEQPIIEKPQVVHRPQPVQQESDYYGIDLTKLALN